MRNMRRARLTDRVMAGRTSQVQVGRTKRKIKALHRKPKKVKVSRKLRAKIKKVISDRSPSGYYQEIITGVFSAPTDNRQNATIIASTTVDGNQGEFFSPSSVINAASVLWNGKTASAIYGLNDATNFNSETLRVNVKKQWVTIKCRNNTERTYTINFYACRRKISEPATGFTALNDWQSALGFEKYQPAATPGGGPGPNVMNLDYTTLYVTPYFTKSVTDKYDIETTKVRLAPGEEYTYTLTGPSMMYDFRKFYAANTAFPFNKKTNVSVFMVGYTDLIGGASSTFGRGKQANTAAGYGLIYETNTYFKLEMPDQTGMVWAVAPAGLASAQTVPAPGVTTYLGNRRDAYGIYNQSNAASLTAPLSRVENEQPNTPATGPF